jgi:uncharacterized membrane protein
MQPTDKALNNASSDTDDQAFESVHDLTKRNIQLIAELEASAKSSRTDMDKFIDAISSFVGSMLFVWIHLIWFTSWTLINRFSAKPFDPFPFNLLTLIVSLEAIILSTFILISQNRQGRIAERRAHLDLQINLLSEQENTKILSMLTSIMTRLEIEDNDTDASLMMESTQPQNMIQQIEEIIESGTSEIEEQNTTEAE